MSNTVTYWSEKDRAEAAARVMAMYEKKAPRKGSLRFGAEAWTKMQAWARVAKGEVTMMGVTKEESPLEVEDVVLLEQEATQGSVEIDGDDLGKHMEEMAAKGVAPNRCMRVWVHTHPRGVEGPSGTDWDTFRKVFGDGSHAVMVILCGETKWIKAWLGVTWEGQRFEKELEVWTEGLKEMAEGEVMGLVEEYDMKVYEGRRPMQMVQESKTQVYVDGKWWDVADAPRGGVVMGVQSGGRQRAVELPPIKDKEGALMTGEKGRELMEKREWLEREEVIWLLDQLVEQAEEVLRGVKMTADTGFLAHEVWEAFDAARECVENCDGWPFRTREGVEEAEQAMADAKDDAAEWLQGYEG